MGFTRQRICAKSGQVRGRAFIRGTIHAAIAVAMPAVAAAQPSDVMPPASPVVQAAPVAAAPTVPTAAPATPAAPVGADAGFRRYLAELRSRALAEGVRPETADSILPTLTFNPRVVALDRNQPDDSQPSAMPKLSDYLARRLTTAQIEAGRTRYRALATMLPAIEAKTGVPGNILIAIWGMETNYGRYVGDFDILRSLASLAYDGRRRELFSGEFIAALKIVDRGLATREMLVGSWAGAMGHPQFLPSSYLARAVDGDGDGRIDIWRSSPDALASIGNYLADAGWQRGQRWGMEVIVPSSLDREAVRRVEVSPTCPRVHARHSRWLTVGEWRRLGLLPMDVAWPSDDTRATLIEPDGPGARAFLTFDNYRALLDYNCSNFYALSVALLADNVSR